MFNLGKGLSLGSGFSGAIPGGSVSFPHLDVVARAEEETQHVLLPENWVKAGQELDPLIVLFFGRRGDGKTLAMTTALAMMQRVHRQRGMVKHSAQNPAGVRLTTNYHVQFSDFNDARIVDMVSSYDERMRNMIIAIDEILSYVPSRRSMARANVDFANFLVQIRKLDIEMLSTTQRPQNIDSQMLDQIDLFIAPVLYNKQWIPELQQWTHKKTGRMIYRPTSCRLLIWDWWGTYTGKQYRKLWPPQISGEPPDEDMALHGVHELFSWFSTKEQVPSLWHKNRDDVIARDWEAGMREIQAEFAPESIEEEKAGVPVATVAELFSALPEGAYLSKFLDVARQLDARVQSLSILASMGSDLGFQVVRTGRSYQVFSPNGSSLNGASDVAGN